MTTTAKFLIDSAWSRSTYNDRGIASGPELVGVINNRVKQLYSMAAKINPTFFGKIAEVPHGLTGWPRPADAELVVAVYLTTGLEVNIVPFNDRLVAFAPRVYSFGRVYRSVGLYGDPADGVLVFYYSQKHPEMDPALPETHAQNTLHESWPEQFNDLIILHLAKYLAGKDSREGEIATYDVEEKLLMATFSDFLQHENHGEIARWERTS